MRSGVPNTTPCTNAPFLCVGHDFGCVSWNARGLFTVDPILRDARRLELHSLYRSSCIISLQETHDVTYKDGSTKHGGLDQLVEHRARSFSSSISSKTGGVLAYVSLKLLNKFTETTAEHIVKGRMQYIHLAGQLGTCQSSF